MNDVLLYHPSGKVSGPKLALYMGIEALQRLDQRQEESPDYVIRWGSRRRIPSVPNKRTLNRRRMLNRYGNRLEQLQRLARAGVMVPHFSTEPVVSMSGGLLGRSFGDGRQTSGGKGIAFYPHGNAPVDGQHDFFVAHIPKDRQFRVHVIGGETRTRELVPDDSKARQQAVWNYGSGFTFRYPKGKEIPVRVVPAAVQAVKALWLDFGAVDVITEGDNAYVLEVNTAPGLSDPTLEWYGDNLARVLGLQEIPGWDAKGLSHDEA